MTHTTDTNQPDASERSPVTTAPNKKLIEVSLPLEAINAAAQHEKSVPRKGHPGLVQEQVTVLVRPRGPGRYS